MRFADEYYFHVPDRRLITHRRGAWTFRPCRDHDLEACAYHLAEHLRPLSPEGTWAQQVVRRTLRTARGLRLETLVYVRGTVIQPGEPPLRLDGWHLASRAPDGAAADEQPRRTGGCAQETEES